jgi:NAD(P)-dependent dehydrogenase (short-subunit alcohol dehydrogenase family)
MSLPGKVAIITGGGQGIGKAIAKAFLEQGMNVAIAERDPEAGTATAAEFQPLGSIQFIQTDISNEESVKQAIQAIQNQWGRIDVLVNNAAIANPENPPITELSLADWNHKLATNLTGAFLCAKHTVPYLRQNQGIIINIASTRAFMSEPNTEAYVAAKGGIVALTHALAISLGSDIRVNCISPGWIDVSEWQKSSTRHQLQLTPQDHQHHPAGRVGKPEDIAAFTVYLAASPATFVTGANFVIDGGMTKKMIYS